MTVVDNVPGLAKPKTLRAIFILNALKILLALGLFIAFKYGGLTVGTLSGDSGASIILFTMFGYMVTFAAIVASILKRNMIALRAAIVVDFLISIPAKAVIGFVVAVIGMGLTFTKPVKAYFAYRN